MRISDWSSDVCSSDLQRRDLRIADTQTFEILRIEAQQPYRRQRLYIRGTPLTEKAGFAQNRTAAERIELLAFAIALDPDLEPAVDDDVNIARQVAFFDHAFSRRMLFEFRHQREHEIGRASCRDRVCQYV